MAAERDLKYRDPGFDTGASSRYCVAAELGSSELITNIGRALLSDTAVESVVRALTAPVNLEFDLTSGSCGDRDDLVEPMLEAADEAELVAQWDSFAR